jgi:peptidoglycan/LPS O-acetylase OafA/YrhL
MRPDTITFALLGIACYFLAFLTSHIVVRWGLPENLRSGLGNQARFLAIDGIRGYLAFGVFVHHCLVTWLFLPEGRWGSLPHNFENQLGATSVAIFFMITAFLFWGRVQSKGGLELKSFVVSRLFRIYPLYLFVLALICMAVGYRSNWVLLEPAGSIAKELAQWLCFRTPDINSYYRTTLIVKGVTWTLLYEAWFYASLPLLVLVFIKKNALWLKLAALAIVAVLFWLNHIEVGIAATFLGGVSAVYWRMNNRRIELARTRAAAFLALACLGGVVFFLYTPFNVLGIALLTVFFVVIACGNTLFGLLEMRAALWLGEISYSIYLCHGLILWVIMQNVLPRISGYDHSTKWFVVSVLGIAPLVILFSSATHLLIEKPFISLGHRVLKPKLAARPAIELDGRAADAVQLG